MPNQPHKQPKKLSPSELKVFNDRRREKRNSERFAYDNGCIDKPDSGVAANARWGKDPAWLKRKRELDGKYQARRWC